MNLRRVEVRYYPRKTGDEDSPVEEVVASGVIIVSPCVVRKIIAKRRARKLLSEEVNFVEEENLRVWGN